MAGPGWWKRRTRGQKTLVVLGTLVVIAAAGAGGTAGERTGDGSGATRTGPDSTLPLVGAPASTQVAQTTSTSAAPGPTATAPTTSVTVPASTSTTAAATTPTLPTTGIPAGEARVVAVSDGDTIVVAFADGAEEEVRLIGIDAPETGEDFSKDATDALSRLLSGKTVRVETDVETRDRYGRLLAYVWTGTVMVNSELLRLGLATLYTVPPNVAHVERLQVAQDEAEAAQAGVWGEPSESPLRIVDVRYDSPGDDSLTLNEEYITFEVLASGTLLGYSVEDQTGHRYRFSDRIYKKGDVFKLRSGEGADTQTDLYWGASGSAIWNNSGDTVKVLDPQNQIVESYGY